MHDNKYDRINTIASKEADRQHVEARLAAFFAAGGHVHQVGTTASANRGHGYNGRIAKAKHSTKNSRGQFA
jgi:hypothetical protein